MLILSNGLCQQADEGFLKVANSLVKRIKKAYPHTTIVSYERKSPLTDKFIELNKFLLSSELSSLLNKQKQPILYIPFPSKAISTAIRIFYLSLITKNKISALLVMKPQMNFVSKILLRLSGVNIIALSKDATSFWANVVGKNKVKYLKTGVDTQKFVPVTKEQSKQLKEKYGFDSEKPVVLHVGHLNAGRNIAHLAKIDSKYQVLLVTSTLTKDEQDTQLKNQLLSGANIKIIDDYIPNIQEIYQLADVYFFPVKEDGHCIDVPLSCLEAGACNIPVVTTNYGEMSEFDGKSGFYFINSFERDNLNQLLQNAINSDDCHTRDAVLDYHWDNALAYLTQEV